MSESWPDLDYLIEVPKSERTGRSLTHPAVNALERRVYAYEKRADFFYRPHLMAIPGALLLILMGATAFFNASLHYIPDKLRNVYIPAEIQAYDTTKTAWKDGEAVGRAQALIQDLAQHQRITCGDGGKPEQCEQLKLMEGYLRAQLITVENRNGMVGEARAEVARLIGPLIAAEKALTFPLEPKAMHIMELQAFDATRSIAASHAGDPPTGMSEKEITPWVRRVIAAWAVCAALMVGIGRLMHERAKRMKKALSKAIAQAEEHADD